jgi:outer membrane protein OmpA-like peptidoglycan-associated protein
VAAIVPPNGELAAYTSVSLPAAAGRGEMPSRLSASPRGAGDRGAALAYHRRRVVRGLRPLRVSFERGITMNPTRHPTSLSTAAPARRVSSAAVLAVGTVLVAVVGALVTPALAQETVMREGQLTERALVDALALPSPAAASAAGGDVVRTRSFRPAVVPAAATATTAGAAAVSAGPATAAGKASILVTFVTDSSELTQRARDALDILGAAMKSERLAAIRFTIEGHADPRGGEDYNMRLSTARAQAVREYLIARHGLAPERINAVGRGATALLDTRNIAAPENRRVTILSMQ